MMPKKKMPLPVTINDCLLLWQMGYEVEIHDGKATAVKRREGKVSKSEVETKRQELYQCIKEGVKTSENIA